jgi:hypothetical protein
MSSLLSVAFGTHDVVGHVSPPEPSNVGQREPSIARPRGGTVALPSGGTMLGAARHMVVPEPSRVGRWLRRG